MTKQDYKIARGEEMIDIYKNEVKIYSISVMEKSINLMKLYDSMEIHIEDVCIGKEDFVKIEDPKNDSDRIYNNTIDFMSRLLDGVNEKLKSLRERQNESIFN